MPKYLFSRKVRGRHLFWRLGWNLPVMSNCHGRCLFADLSLTLKSALTETSRHYSRGRGTGYSIWQDTLTHQTAGYAPAVSVDPSSVVGVTANNRNVCTHQFLRVWNDAETLVSLKIDKDKLHPLLLEWVELIKVHHSWFCVCVCVFLHLFAE